MFLYLSKILPLFVYPPGSTIVLLVLAALIWRWKRWLGWMLSFAALGSLYLMSTWAIAESLESSLESQYPPLDVSETPSADAIVVLGGYLHIPNGRHKTYELTDSTDRLWMAARLFKAGKAPIVLLAGGNVAIYGESDISEAASAKKLLVSWDVAAGAILTEERSQNTHENAEFSAPLLAARGAKKLILVTSAMHMPRAVAIFKRVGLQPIPVPTDYYSGWENRVTLFRWLPEAENLAHANRAVREWLGIAVYKARGWA